MRRYRNGNVVKVCDIILPFVGVALCGGQELLLAVIIFDNTKFQVIESCWICSCDCLIFRFVADPPPTNPDNDDNNDDDDDDDDGFIDIVLLVWWGGPDGGGGGWNN